jgi:peptide/nickel transport system substrate-binding protein
MSPRSSVHALVAMAAVSALALTGCAGAAPTSSGERVDGGTIVYAHQQEPACVFGGWIEQAYLSYQVLDNLVSLDEDHQVVPWLAESWEESEDGLSWSFTLKDGVEFTDGTPVNAEAIAYNFDYWVAGGNSTALVWLLDYYESATAVDDLTVRIDLLRPYPRFADNLTQGYFGIQSQNALETRTDEENCAAPIGSGAFIVDRWDRGQEIVLTRNDGYTSWPANAEHTGPAYVEQIDWKFVPDATTRVAALQSGEVSAIYDVPAVQWQTLDDGGYQLQKYVTPGRPQQLVFNAQVGPFTDEKVRQAFAYSLDREQIVETIGHGVIPFEGNGGVSQTTPGYSQKAADAYSLDLDKANALLDDAGWNEVDDEGFRTKDGERLTVVLPYGAGSILNADGAAILQGVKEQATATGFDVELIPVPLSELFAGAYSAPDEHDIAVGYWTAVTAGILYINWRPSTEDKPNFANQGHYNDDVLAQLILDANSAADIDEQNALYQEAQEYIADRALSIGLYDRLSTLAVSPKLQGVWQEHAQGGPTFYDAYLTE